MQLFCERCNSELKLAVKKAFKKRSHSSNMSNHKLVFCTQCGYKNIVPVINRMTERF